MEPTDLILRIKNQELPIEEVFDELVEFLAKQDNDVCVELLRRMRTDLHPDHDIVRMMRIGELGAGSDEYKKQMIRIFNYAEKHKLSLGAASGYGKPTEGSSR